MSRSFKKTPIIKDNTYSKLGKRYANKRVRKYDVDDGNAYRKIYEQYNICDYSFGLYGCRKEDGIPVYYQGRKMSYDEIMEYWRK
jgi:hypothetical protein